MCPIVCMRSDRAASALVQQPHRGASAPRPGRRWHRGELAGQAGLEGGDGGAVLRPLRVEVEDVTKFFAGEAVLAHVTDPIVRVRLSTRPSRAPARPLADRIYVTP